MSHTPGPWEQKLNRSTEMVEICGDFDCDADDEGRPVYMSTVVCEIADNRDEVDNARAIAALPELLKALHKIAILWPSFNALQVASGIAKEAIAKATGGAE